LLAKIVLWILVREFKENRQTCCAFQPGVDIAGFCSAKGARLE
jgi:hypothetical protein